jgi:hypothetical protein
MCLVSGFLQIGSQGTIKKIEGACLAGHPEWMSVGQAKLVQPIRANNSFYVRPWFDSVQVLRIDVHSQEELAYTELRLFFEAHVSKSGSGTLGIFCDMCVPHGWYSSF